jgi:hypothetical protein
MGEKVAILAILATLTATRTHLVYDFRSGHMSGKLLTGPDRVPVRQWTEGMGYSTSFTKTRSVNPTCNRRIVRPPTDNDRWEMVPPPEPTVGPGARG